MGKRKYVLYFVWSVRSVYLTVILLLTLANLFERSRSRVGKYQRWHVKVKVSTVLAAGSVLFTGHEESMELFQEGLRLRLWLDSLMSKSG